MGMTYLDMCECCDGAVADKYINRMNVCQACHTRILNDQLWHAPGPGPAYQRSSPMNEESQRALVRLASEILCER